MIFRVARIPSIRGIRTSINATSGRSRRADSTASAPLDRLADHREAAGGADDAAEPGPDQGLVVGDDDPQRHRWPPGSGNRRGHPEPLPGQRPGRELAAAQADPLPHPGDPVPGSERGPGAGPGPRRPDAGQRGGTGARVGDLDAQVAVVADRTHTWQ